MVTVATCPLQPLLWLLLSWLLLPGAPGQPAGVHVHGLPVDTTVDLWWQPGEQHGDVITKYLIEYNNNFNPAWVPYHPSEAQPYIEAQTTTIDNGEYPLWRHHVITNVLSPGTHYRFRVTAASGEFGFGEPSLPSDSIKLDDAAPIYAPEIVTGGGGSVGMLRIKWTPLAPEFHGGANLYYKVYWRLHRAPNDMWQYSKSPIYGGNLDRDGFVTFHHKVGMEFFYTEYDVKVQAINIIGAGPNTTVTSVMSAEDMTTPQQVLAVAINSTAAWISWELPNNTREGMRGKIMGFQINWWIWGEDRLFTRFVRHYGTTLGGTVIGLPDPNGDYWVDVQVFNSAGLSRPSGHAYLNTNYDAPHHYPEYVTITSHGEDSVRVSWRGVSWFEQIESPVTGYKVWYWPYTDDIRTAKIAEFGRFDFTGVIHGLQKDQIYKARVLAINDGGDGKKTPPTFFTLGGQVRFDPISTEILASAGFLKPSVLTTALCFAFVLLSRA
ncbi:hypothetical protein BaRGS_00023705 [Batillaria attramentaria]|uniref:Fibronectin type-III domain-containing protein n=1 Tax=Batillaria attramentaria TaxID=370345 RepID=A0ABD0KD39_9CAEN